MGALELSALTRLCPIPSDPGQPAAPITPLYGGENLF